MLCFDPRPEQKLEPTPTVQQSGDPDVIFINHTQCPSPSCRSSTVLNPPPPHFSSASHSRATRSEHFAQQLWCLGEPCGAACTLHLPEESHHYGVVVKCFASGQCGLGLIPGWSRSWSRRLQSSKTYQLFDMWVNIRDFTPSLIFSLTNPSPRGQWHTRHSNVFCTRKKSSRNRDQMRKYFSIRIRGYMMTG